MWHRPEILCEHKCDIIQGFLFSPPVPHEALQELLEKPSMLEPKKVS